MAETKFEAILKNKTGAKVEPIKVAPEITGDVNVAFVIVGVISVAFVKLALVEFALALICV